MILHNALEQFAVFPIVTFKLGELDISFNNSAIFITLVILFITFVTLYGTYESTIIPNRWQSFLETIYDFIFSLVTENVGSEGQRYFPFIYVLFNFILFCNLIGMVPYSFTATSHLIVTAGLALTVWFSITFIGFSYHGIGFFGFFFPQGIPVGIAPVLIPIELVSYCSRPISLSVRLFANMTSGHTLFKIIAGFGWTLLGMGGALYFAGFLPIVFLVIFTVLEIGICCVQAYIFTLLTTIYIKDSVLLH